MENLKLENMEISPLDRAKRHVTFQHRGASGWITLAKKEPDGGWRQYHYQSNELAVELPKWLGEDVYFSQNTFYKPQRRIENIRQLRALYVDVDCHTIGYEPEWVVGKLDIEVFYDNILPEPNLIIFSGRGIVCVWLIEPVPYKALPLWKAVENYFYEQLSYVGADKKSLDPTRVFRIDGSVNSKSKREVVVEYRHGDRYVLRDLQYEYLPELTRTGTGKKGRKGELVRLHNIQTLHYARLLDLIRLAELRNYDLKGYRELFCFLLFFASKKCRELQEKIHRLAGSMNLPFNRARRERLNGRKRAPQAVALSRKRENVGVMDQTIHQRCRQAVVPKHSIPLSKL